MTARECGNYEKCEAPLCPLEDCSNYIWYPNEAVCKLTRGIPDWVKKQRRIVNVGASPDYYFTVEMLNVLHQIRKGITGASPDDMESESKWFRQRRGLRATKSNGELAITERKKSVELAMAKGVGR